MMARLSLSLVAVLLVAGCGEEPRPQVESGHLLFVRAAGGFAALPYASEGPSFRAAHAVAAPDFSVVATADAREGTTVLRRLDRSGNGLERIALEGELVPQVVSPDGDLVALGPPRIADGAPYVPEARAGTNLAVVDAEAAPARVREFDLEGNFEPEAFSTDNSELFMIEFLPALDPERYRVRRLRLSDGRVMPIGRLKNAAPEQMQGTGRTQIYSPAADELYTLYTQQTEAGHGEHDHRESAFVHLLNLDEKWAHCIDLPHEFGGGSATASALATSPQGERLYVADWTNGVVAVVRPYRLRVARTARIEFGAPDDETFARATRDRLYVAGDDTVVVLALPSLRPVARWSGEGEIEGLNVAPDGSVIYVSVSGKINKLDAATGAVLDSAAVPGAAAIEYVAP